jgi:hypothetical protein
MSKFSNSDYYLTLKPDADSQIEKRTGYHTGSDPARLKKREKITRLFSIFGRFLRLFVLLPLAGRLLSWLLLHFSSRLPVVSYR